MKNPANRGGDGQFHFQIFTTDKSRVSVEKSDFIILKVGS
jgi:hypothetical protein